MTNGTLSVQVPVDDGAIQRAFEQLDAQMDAWLAAMSRAEQVLAGAPAARLPEPASTPEAAVEEAECPRPANVETASPSVVSEPDEIPPSASASPVSESIPVATSPDPQAPAVQVDASPAVKCIPPPASPGGPDRKLDSQDNRKRTDEDEALLASLDEETAKNIRVMRRLCMNSKSVKELLVEYQAKGKGRPEGPGTKKSWFRRGK